MASVYKQNQLSNQAEAPMAMAQPAPAPMAGGDVYGTMPVSQQQQFSAPPMTSGGGGAPMAPRPGQGGVSSPPATLPGQPQPAQMPHGAAPSGGDQWGKFNKTFGGIQATPTAYESDVLGGHYLDLENNPYAQQYAEAIRNESNEEYQRTASQALSPFASAGGTLGFSGLSAGLQGRMADDQMENVNNQMAQFYSGLYQGERQLQNEMAGILSGRTEQMYGTAAAAHQANQSLKAAQSQAQASRYAARLSYNLGQDRLADQMMQHADMMDYRYQQLSEYAAGNLWGDLAGVGGQNQTNPSPNPWLSGLQGGAGGYLAGGGQIPGMMQ